MSTYHQQTYLVPPVSGTVQLQPSVNLIDRSLYAANNNIVPDPVWGARNVLFEADVLKLTNEHRKKAGVGELDFQSALNACAGWKALHMSGYSYMSHSDPAPPIDRSTGQRFSDFRASGGGWGENIAYGYSTPQAVVTGWINSPGHRANLENGTFKSIGIGAAQKSGPWYWAQCFGTQTPDTIPPPAPPPPTPVPQKLQFSDRHAIGIIWDTAAFQVTSLELFVWAGGSWSKVRDVPNHGNTYVTYPLAWQGEGRVKLSGGDKVLEGTYQVRSL